MSRARRTMLGVAVAALLTAGALVGWHSLGDKDGGNQLVLYGNVDIRQVELAFNARDRITTMLAVEGQQVEADELLAVLDTRLLSLSVREAEAKVAAREQALARLLAGSRPEEIRRAQAQVAAAQAEAADAGLLYRRVHDAFAQGAATQQELDNARSSHQVAQARLLASQEDLALALAGPRKEDIAAGRAELEAAKAQLALLQRQLADARLYAPCSGVIQARILEPGDMASPDRPVYTLAITDPVWVRAYISETDLGKIWPGMKARVTTDSFPGKHYEGWVGYISPTAEFTPKTVQTEDLRAALVYQVRVYVRCPNSELRLGMPATVTIDLRQPRTPSSSPATGPGSVPASAPAGGGGSAGPP